MSVRHARLSPRSLELVRIFTPFWCRCWACACHGTVTVIGGPRP